MNPRRLHSDTIFSISSLVFCSAIRGESLLEPLAAVKRRQAPVRSRPIQGSGTGIPPVCIVQPTHGQDARATSITQSLCDCPKREIGSKPAPVAPAENSLLLSCLGDTPRFV